MSLLSLAPLAVLVLGSTAPPTEVPDSATATGPDEVTADDEVTGQEPTETTTETETATETQATPTDGRPWLRRWAPERNVAELGIYGGLLIPSRDIELFEADFDLPEQGHKPLRRVLPDIGARLSYYPMSYFGVEIEGGVMPGRTDAGDSVLLWTGRGSLVGQLGLWSVTPFVLLGGGLLGVSSRREALGDDVDASMHFGGGVKVYMTHLTQLRLDVRDVVAAGRGYNEGVVHSAEILLGFSVTLGRATASPPARPATDGPSESRPTPPAEPDATAPRSSD